MRKERPGMVWRHGPYGVAVAEFARADLVEGSAQVGVVSRAFTGDMIGPRIAGAFRARRGFLDGFVIEAMPFGFREQEDIFVRLGAAVAHRFWHRVRFVPDDVLTAIPTIGL